MIDDPIAHSLGKELYQAILEAIVDGRCRKQFLCAQAALVAASIEFGRWFS